MKTILKAKVHFVSVIEFVIVQLLPSYQRPLLRTQQGAHHVNLLAFLKPAGSNLASCTQTSMGFCEHLFV